MKRILSFCVAFVFGIAFLVLPFFSCNGLNPSYATSSLATETNESDIENKNDIIGVEENKIPSDLKSIIARYETPFDSGTQKTMNGVSLNPQADDYGQVNVSSMLIGKNFSIESGESIYLWVYIPSSIALTLKVKFSSSGGENIVWEVEPSIYGTPLINEIVGWKLLELPISDATTSLNGNNLNEIVFSSFGLSYTNEEEVEINLTKETFSFFHVFRGKAKSETVSILKTRNYSYYEFSDEIYSTLNDLYFEDKFDYKSETDLFKYLVVGKKDLKNYSDSSMTFEVKLTVPNEADYVFTNAETYTFKQVGNYTLNVALYKYSDSSSTTVFTLSHTFSVLKMKFGKFNFLDIIMDKGESNLITFEVSSNFVFDSNISIKMGDSSIAKVEYYATHNTYQITILGLQKGKTQLTVSAKGHREGTTTSETYSQTIDVYVNDSDSGTRTKVIILLVCLSLYLLAFLIYVIMKLSKKRDNGVR